MFVCNVCKAPALSIRKVIELGPTEYSDDVQLQTLRCGVCRTAAIARYEEWINGPVSTWQHEAWPAPEEVVERLEAEIDDCPAIREYWCGCFTHRTLTADVYCRFLSGTGFEVVR